MRLFGKDGRGGGRELIITAYVCSPPLLFEPRRDKLGSLGLGCQESLVTIDAEGCVLVACGELGRCLCFFGRGFDLGTVRYLDPVTSDVCECLGPVVSAVRE